MPEDDGSYDLLPEPSPPTPPKPGEPGWEPPVPIIEKADEPEEDVAPPPDPDTQQHKAAAMLGYVFFVIPLILAPNSPYARFHANQGLLVFILGIISTILIAILQGAIALSGLLENIPILQFSANCIFHLLQFALLIGSIALVVYGIIQANNGLKKPLPLIGHFTLIKP